MNRVISHLKDRINRIIWNNTIEIDNEIDNELTIIKKRFKIIKKILTDREVYKTNLVLTTYDEKETPESEENNDIFFKFAWEIHLC